MNFNASIRVVSFLIITLSLSGCIETCDTAQDASIDRTADESAIRSLLSANFAASTARDAASVAATYMADGDAWIAGLARVSTDDGIRRPQSHHKQAILWPCSPKSSSKPCWLMRSWLIGYGWLGIRGRLMTRMSG